MGITTITQDVEDFIGSQDGKGNRSKCLYAILLKQSPTAVDVLTDVFKLTSEEKKRLSQFPVGQGLFFAGQNHVHIQIIASATETSLITTNPDQVANINDAAAEGNFNQVQGTIDLGNRLSPGSAGTV